MNEIDDAARDEVDHWREVSEQLLAELLKEKGLEDQRVVVEVRTILGEDSRAGNGAPVHIRPEQLSGEVPREEVDDGVLPGGRGGLQDPAA